MASFQSSSYGITVVVNEEFSSPPTMRVIFIIVTLILTLSLILRLSLLFWSLWLKGKKSRIITVFYSVFILNILLNAVHITDTIARPVAYFTPKWLYKSYIISRMELLFLFNIIITIYGYINSYGLIEGMGMCKEQKIRNKCRQMMIYVILSLSVSSFHYLIEPLRSFTFWRNTNMMIAILVTWILAAVIARVSYSNSRLRFVDPSKDLAQLIQNDNYIDENDDIETFNRNDVKVIRQRSRSQTPSEI